MEQDTASAERTQAVRERIFSAGCAVLQAGTGGYAQATWLWNGAVAAVPTLIAQCASVSDVQRCLTAARTNGLLVSVLAGGQD